MPIIIIRSVLIMITLLFEVKKKSLDFFLKQSPKKEEKSYFGHKLLGHIEKIPRGEIKGKALS